MIALFVCTNLFIYLKLYTFVTWNGKKITDTEPSNVIQPVGHLGFRHRLLLTTIIKSQDSNRLMRSFGKQRHFTFPDSRNQ